MGADHVIDSTQDFREEVKQLTDGLGADVIYDPVGGDRFLDGVRCLKRFGRLVVVGFAAGTIPEIKVNRLLLRNVSIVGAAWGEAVAGDPELPRRTHAELLPMIDSGVVKPPVGAIFPLDQGVDAYRLLDERQAVAKVVVQIGAER